MREGWKVPVLTLNVYNFLVFFGDFLVFRKNFEIQDGGSEMAAAWTYNVIVA